MKPGDSEARTASSQADWYSTGEAEDTKNLDDCYPEARSTAAVEDTASSRGCGCSRAGWYSTGLGFAAPGGWDQWIPGCQTC